LAESKVPFYFNHVVHLIITAGCNGVTDRGEKRSQMIEVVDHEEGGSQHLLGGEQVVEVAPGVTAAGVAAAGADQRSEVVFEGFVFQVHGVRRGMGRDVSGIGRDVSGIGRDGSGLGRDVSGFDRVGFIEATVSDGTALDHREGFGYLKTMF
jgi:hypothetical protein